MYETCDHLQKKTLYKHINQNELAKDNISISKSANAFIELMLSQRCEGARKGIDRYHF